MPIRLLDIPIRRSACPDNSYGTGRVIDLHDQRAFIEYANQRMSMRTVTSAIRHVSEQPEVVAGMQCTQIAQLCTPELMIAEAGGSMQNSGSVCGYQAEGKHLGQRLGPTSTPGWAKLVYKSVTSAIVSMDWCGPSGSGLLR
jgi:hypothetical protein